MANRLRSLGVGVAALLFCMTASAVNLLTNSGFTSNTTGWAAEPNATLTWSAIDSNGGGGSGSALVTNTSPTGSMGTGIEQCISGITAGATYSFGGKALFQTGQANTGELEIGVRWLGAGANCSGATVGAQPRVSVVSPSASWVSLASGAQVAPVGAVNVLFLAFPSKVEAGGQLIGNFDDLYFDDGPVVSSDLGLTVAGSPNPVVAGNNVTYTITAGNNGPGAASGLSLSVPLPAGTTFVSLLPAGGWTCTSPAVGSGGTVSCWRASLASGASGVSTLVVAVGTGTPPGTITLAASISATSFDPNLGDNTAAAVTAVNAPPVSSDLGVSVTESPNPVAAGNNVTYTITVANNGPDAASGLSLTAPLPAGTTFVSLAPAGGWTCTSPSVGSGGTVSCTAASLANGGNAVFTLVAAVGAGTPPGTITQISNISATSSDPNLVNNAFTVLTTVTAPVAANVTAVPALGPLGLLGLVALLGAVGAFGRRRSK